MGNTINILDGINLSQLIVTGITTVAAGSTAAPSITPTGDSNTGIFFPSADTIAFGEGGAEAARIDSSGRLLLNRTSSATGSILEVDASSNVAQFHHTGSSDTIGIYMRHGRGLSGYTGKMITFRRNDNTEVGSVVIGEASTSFNTSSDYRLKENFTAVTDGIARLKQLKPGRFNFIVNSGRIVDGFIAHEVQDVVPEAVHGTKDAVDDDGNPVYQGIDQSKLVPLLTAALQEAMERIEQLEAKVAALETA